MHKRDTSGLKKHAQMRSQEAKRRTEEGIRQLIKDKKPISFKTVAEISGVSRAWLYQQDDIRARIEHLRSQQSTRKSVPIEQKATRSSNTAVVRTLKERVKKVQAENHELRRQLEVVYGRLVHAEGEAERYKRQLEMIQRERDKQQENMQTNEAPSSTADSFSAVRIVEEAGIPVNATLSRVIRAAAPGTVRNALEAFQQASEIAAIRHPGGWLKRAIEEAWEPNIEIASDETTELDRFNEWFPAAREQGLVLASRQESGEILVLTSDEEWVNFQQFLETHPST